MTNIVPFRLGLCLAFLMSIVPVVNAHADASPTPSAAAGACGAAAGKVIFEDKFADATGGWDTDDSAKFGQPALALTLGAKEESWEYLESNFTADNAVYCLEAIVPKPAAKNNEASLGLIFLHTDEKNYYKFIVWSDSTIGLVRVKDGDEKDIFDDKDDRVKLQPGSPVTLKLTLTGGIATAAVDGIEVKQTRLQMPAESAGFGLQAQSDKPAGKPTTLEFSHIRITAAP